MSPASVRLVLAASYLAVAMFFSGCTTAHLARVVVRAPNLQNSIPELHQPKAMEMAARIYDAVWTVPVGPPNARLSVAVVEPGMFRLEHDLKIEPQGKRNLLTVKFRAEKIAGPAQGPPKGTILLLHGVMMSKETMLHWALRLAQAGYRTVLVDLRGHGHSTGQWITYGAVEAADLSQVLDDLERRGRLAGHLGVLGNSYGAAMALQLAARDARVKTVVALQPFSAGDAAVGEFGRAVAPRLARFLSGPRFDRALRRAENLAGFSWKQSDVAQAVDRVKVPILFFHGSKDTWISPKHSEILRARSNGQSRLVILEDDSHPTLAARLKPIDADVINWFDEHLKGVNPTETH